MLRVIAHKSAAAAKKYYEEELKRGDYYAEGKEVAGKWHGKAARRLGLNGPVKAEEFAALIDNRHPVTGEKLTPRMKADRRVGYDINFHAPKSVSIVHALSGDERILSAFRVAVAETMEEIEALAATRVRKGGAQSERFTGNLAWAEFVHFTARPVKGVSDPHLHAHLFTANLTHDEVEDRWKAASWAGIKKDAPYCEAVFHSRLSAKIAELGYGIERTKTGWEIAGIPRTLISKFSRRTAQIEELAAKKGIIDPKAKDKLGAASREGKRKGQTAEDLKKEWAARLTETERTLIGDLAKGTAQKPASEKIIPAQAFDHACEKVFAKQSVEEPRRLLAEVLRFGVGHVSPEQAWSEFQRRGMIVRQFGGETLCTTLDVLTEEVALINFVRSGRGMFAPLAPRNLTFLNPSLSAEAKAAVRHVLNCPDQIVGIRGVAGAGKTTAMIEVVKQIEATGRRVFPFAPSADASRGTLREAGFENAETVAHLLASKKLQSEIRGNVIWIDEAGQVGVRDMLEIARIAGDSTPIIVTGDTAQHAPVPRGDSLRLMQHYGGLRIAEMTQICRQQREDYRKVVSALSKGDLRTAFRRLDEMGAIVEVPDDSERYRLLAQDFLSLSRKNSVPLVVSPTHAEGALVTTAIREAKREAGNLGQEHEFTQLHDLRWEAPDRRMAENYHQGMVVQFHQNASGGIKRGSVFRVIGRGDNGAVRIRDEKGRELALPLNEAVHFQVYEERSLSLASGDRIRITRNGDSADGRRLNNGNVFNVQKIGSDGKITLHTGATLDGSKGLHLAYGYCQTSHSTQSKSVRDVLVAQSEVSFSAGSMQQFYVSLSRGKESLRIYTDNRQELQQAVGNSSQRRAGVELAGLTERQIAALMSGELNGRQWREMIQSRREGDVKNHLQNLLRERKQDASKSQVLDFRQYIEMRRALAGPDGKSRSKGHPAPPSKGKVNDPNRRRSFIRPTQPREPFKKPTAANENRKVAPKPKNPRQGRLAKAFTAGASHFKKVAGRAKTAARVFKDGKRTKTWPKEKANQLAQHRIKARKAKNHATAKAKTKVKQKAPTPPAPKRVR